MSRDFFRSWRLYKDSSSSGEVGRHSAQEQWELVTLEMESWRRDETDGVEMGVEVEVEVMVVEEEAEGMVEVGEEEVVGGMAL